jgi:hypothetical protein
LVNLPFLAADVEVTTFSMSLSEIFVSEVMTMTTILASLTETNASGEREELTVWVVSYFVSVTYGISYQPVVLPFVTRTQSYVSLHAQESGGTPPPEKNKALIIGVATGAGLLAAVLAGIAVFLISGMRAEEEGESSGMQREGAPSSETVETPTTDEVEEEKPEVVEAPVEMARRDLDQIANDDLRTIDDAERGDIWI